MPDPTVLVAGVGNLFCGDDGFGVEVARRLLRRPLPPQMQVVDFGTRGFDLACTLGSADVTVLVNAYPHGGEPGTLKVLEPDLDALDTIACGVEAHGLNPVDLLRLARAMEVRPGKLLMVGCQPKTFGGESGTIGLSAPVEAAVGRAVELISSMAADLG